MFIWVLIKHAYALLSKKILPYIYAIYFPSIYFGSFIKRLGAEVKVSQCNEEFPELFEIKVNKIIPSSKRK